MHKLAIQTGIAGGALGVLAGAIELSIGTHIRPWIGNKEHPAILGFVTILLSGMALVAILSSRTLETLTNDSKLAIFLGVLLPAAICFTTVGRLWYVPGPLLIITTVLLANKYWSRPTLRGSPETFASIEWSGRIIAGLGSVMMLASVGLAFWKGHFGLFRSQTLLGTEPVRFEIVPMDFVRRTYLSGSATTIDNIEVSRVMIVYILLIVGTAFACIASLTASRLFTGIGGGIACIGMVLFIVWLPGILAQAHYLSKPLFHLLGSLGWGWYISVLRMCLTLIASLFNLRSG